MWMIRVQRCRCKGLSLSLPAHKRFVLPLFLGMFPAGVVRLLLLQSQTKCLIREDIWGALFVCECWFGFLRPTWSVQCRILMSDYLLRAKLHFFRVSTPFPPILQTESQSFESYILYAGKNLSFAKSLNVNKSHRVFFGWMSWSKRASQIASTSSDLRPRVLQIQSKRPFAGTFGYWTTLLRGVWHLNFRLEAESCSQVRNHTCFGCGTKVWSTCTCPAG